MKKYLFLTAFIACILNATAQTFVTGGIYSNTTWTTAGSPYIVTDTVAIETNDTLTILPGVVVKFNTNAYLYNKGGVLIAIGTPTDSIIFTSNSATPHFGIWKGISNGGSLRYARVSFAENGYNLATTYPTVSHCLFSYAKTGLNSTSNANEVDSCVFMFDSTGVEFANTINGCIFLNNDVAASGLINTIENSTFKYNRTGFRSGDVPITIVKNCEFDSNNVCTYYLRRVTGCNYKYNTLASYGDDTIEYNNFYQNNIAISEIGADVPPNVQPYIELNTISDNKIGIEGLVPWAKISCNSICNNTSYNMIASGSNLSVKNNYWCLPDSISIQATIYDAYQNFNYGFLYFTPFDTVTCTIPCNASVSASATHTLVCTGNFTTLHATVSDINPVYTVIWQPGSLSGTSVTVVAASTQTYTVTVTDSSGCTASATVRIDTMHCAPPCYLSASASATKYSICSGDSTTLVAFVSDSNPVYTVTWQPGSLSGTNVMVTPHSITTYTMTVTDSGGCTATSMVTINSTICNPPCSSLYPPSICYVTTDTSSTYNTVVWQKTGMDTVAIDSVIIYRRNDVSQYLPIQEQSVHAWSTYKDYGARPLVEASYYKLGIHDTCGVDTALSNLNETVFLQSVASGPSRVNLSWNFYQGTPVIYYLILRDDSGTGNWHAIDSVNGGINAYTDLSAPVNSGLRYLIAMDWNLACTPSLIRPRHGRYVFNPNGGYSNITKAFPTGIVNLNDNSSIKVYPNPVNDAVSISFNNAFEGLVKITDVLGQDVYTANLSANGGSVKQLSVSNLANGVYFITLQGKGALYRTKVIKM